MYHSKIASLQLQKIASLEAKIARIENLLATRTASSLEQPALELIENFVKAKGKFRGQITTADKKNIACGMGRLSVGEYLVCLVQNGKFMINESPSKADKPLIDAVKTSLEHSGVSLIPIDFDAIHEAFKASGK